jgi:MFS family permease
MSTTVSQPVANRKKLFLAAGIGNFFEIFDFFVFVFLSSVIADLFFPKDIGYLAIVFTYMTVTISYMLRPFGAIILGSLGDKYGRKSIFSLSILMTAIPSLVIGLSPTFHQVGYFAVAILLVSRIFQGFSSGAEMPGSVTYIAETYHHKNYYFYSAWMPFGANMSIALGSWAIRNMVEMMDHDFLYSFGWRIPFILGSLLAVIGFYIRKNIAESSDFQAAKAQHKVQKIPALALFTTYRKELIMGIFLVLIASLITSVFHVFLPNLFVKFLHLELSIAANISSIGALTVSAAIILSALLASKINPTTIVKLSIVGLIAVLILVLTGILPLDNLKMLYSVVILLSIFAGGVNGIYWGLLVDLFPVEVRYSGVAACFSLASLIGGGLTPLWTSSILALTNDYRYIITICLLVSILCLINSFFVARYFTKRKCYFNSLRAKMH